VESLRPLWGEGEGWTPSEDPIVTIGTDDGPEEYSLFRVEAARRLPNGHIVIANGSSNKLRYCGSSGMYLYSAGRDGDSGRGSSRSFRACGSLRTRS